MDRENRIIVVDDEENILRFMTRALEKKGYLVYPFFNAEEPLKKLRDIHPDLVISDIRLNDGRMSGVDFLKQIKAQDPEVNVILITAHASVDTAVSAMHFGAADYLIKPFKVEELCSVVKKALSSKRLLVDDTQAQKDFERKYDFQNFIGTSSRIKAVHKMIEKVSATDTTVLITGESGTGKELVARSIHYNSKRKDKPFVSINCAALPEALLESELFGYEKGSFTGALNSKVGLLEFAQDGTFFFDEVGDMPLFIQAKLLRVLQEREIRRVGGLQTIRVNIRVVAATSRDLKEEVQSGRFREDLYYRLNVVPIHMPPLREREEDVPLLVDHFLKFYCEKHMRQPIELTADACQYLQEEVPWSGNIRELENLMERIVTLAEEVPVNREQIQNLHGQDPETSEPEDQESSSNGNGHGRNLKDETDEFEKKLILGVLLETKGNKFQAAKKLQISRQSLQYKIKKYQLE